MLRSTATPVNELRNCSTSQLQELLPNLSRAELLCPRNGCDGSLRIDLRPAASVGNSNNQRNQTIGNQNIGKCRIQNRKLQKRQAA